MSTKTMFGAATFPVLGYGWTGEATGARRTVPPVFQVDGTGLPIDGRTSRMRGLGTGADQVQRTAVAVRVPADVVPGIPPRWGPVRC